MFSSPKRFSFSSFIFPTVIKCTDILNFISTSSSKMTILSLEKYMFSKRISYAAIFVANNTFLLEINVGKATR